MKSNASLFFLSLIFILLSTSCDKVKDQIRLSPVNQNLRIPLDDLDSEAITTTMVEGQVMVFEDHSLDLDNNGVLDITFQVIDLTLWNGDMPDFLDNMAARVITSNHIQILDSSTFGYADALVDEAINENASWSDGSTFVLGTIANAGLFEGVGERHLAFRIKSGSDYNYGWIKLNCSSMSDQLDIISFAINEEDNAGIDAGQVE